MTAKKFASAIVAAILLAGSLPVSAASYGTVVLPAGISPTGVWLYSSQTFSATGPDDWDDILAFSMAVEATAPIFTGFCPTPTGYYFSGWQSAINNPVGNSLSQSGLWYRYCTGFYQVGGIHVWYVDGGDSFVTVSPFPWGLF